MEGGWLNLVGIVLIDLVLSGDNAVVIGMVVRGLPAPLRKQAIFAGTLGAVGLRVAFTILAALLLTVPYLRALGGLTLFWIAAKLLKEEDNASINHSANGFWQAVGLIVVADITLSLDNVLAVAAASEGHIGLLAFGLALSIPILMLGASLVAQLLSRWPWMNLLGALVIVWAGARLVVRDPKFHALLPLSEWQALLLGLVLTFAFMRGDLSSIRRVLRYGA
jgi:integral membrane protein, YjbE family